MAKNSKTFGCDDCKYLAKNRCKLWDVKVSDPHNSHCGCGKPRKP